jgi:hypothetical protein
MYSDQEMIVPGNALSVQEDKPFRALNKFGTAFLSKFEASMCQAPILQSVTFVDTPGVLSGEKQRIGRSYDYVEVTNWFAERADLILLLFDAHKLDISDEFKRVIEILKGQDDKIRVVLNKADRVTSQQLMRVYGALMWALGKVISTPEVVRVYIGSFWDGPCMNEASRELFQAEQNDLLKDLRDLPRNNAVRKLNELVKRARLAKVHAYLISYLKDQMPSMFYKDSKQKELLENLPDVFHKVMLKYHLPMGDFPDIRKFKAYATQMEFAKFPKLNQILIDSMDAVLASDIPKLMQRIQPPKNDSMELNPFAEAGPLEWAAVLEKKADYDMQFTGLGPVAGKVSGALCKNIMMESGLSTEVLRKIWQLADVDKDGALDADEFALALHLIAFVQKSGPEKALFNQLPSTLVPPGKRLAAGAAAAATTQAAAK